jgi:isocitrate/isopropylmalate dehydrogenase
LNCSAAAGRIHNAVARTLRDGHKTADLGGRLSTAHMGDAVLQNL